jgi:hypothetical protein
MGMDLYGDKDRCFRLRCGLWRSVRGLAVQYGWQPAGTIVYELEPIPGDVSGRQLQASNRPIEDWCGTYDSNDYQTVTADDAANLANAIERALAELPSEKSESYQTPERADDVIDFVAALAGWNDYLTKFVEFCRGGKFVIG